MTLTKIWGTASLLALLAGCGDSNENPPASDGPVPQQDAGQPPSDGAPPALDSALDSAPTSGCPCGANEICTTEGKCVATPQPKVGEVYGELILLRQVNPYIDGVLSALGKAEVLLKDWTALPQDKRQHWTTQDPGGDCAYEIDTTYPYFYDGKNWPAGLGLGAGKITFKPQGAPPPGQIELDPLDMNPGYVYFHGDVPPPLEEGYGKHPDLFEIKYVPLGKPFEVQFAGGPDIGAMSFKGGETAQDFSITSPAVEQPGATAPANAPLKITWSPAQPGATMEVFITQNWGLGGATLLTCTVPDDGETTIRAAAMGNFLGDVGIQLRRSVMRYEQTQTAGGKVMQIHLIGRHARLGKLSLTK
jgi:hypothetical protein